MFVVCLFTFIRGLLWFLNLRTHVFHQVWNSLNPPSLAFSLSSLLGTLSRHLLYLLFKKIIYLFGCIRSSLQHWGLFLFGAQGFSCSLTCGFLVPKPGIKPTTLALQGRFLITGPPEKSLLYFLDLASKSHILLLGLLSAMFQIISSDSRLHFFPLHLRLTCSLISPRVLKFHWLYFSLLEVWLHSLSKLLVLWGVSLTPNSCFSRLYGFSKHMECIYIIFSTLSYIYLKSLGVWFHSVWFLLSCSG